MWTIYRHSKGLYYLTVGTALHSESLEPFEVYRALYDNELSPLWARPAAMFHGMAESGGKRFTPVGRVRVAAPEDMTTVLAFGYDAWGAGMSEAEFTASYASNRNHLRGRRYIFELPSGEAVSNLNTIRFARGLTGLASLSVAKAHRRHGIGSLLVRAVMEIVRLEDPTTRFMLYSEVGPTMYERLGFRVLPERLQFHPPSVAMATGGGEVTEREVDFLKEYF